MDFNEAKSILNGLLEDNPTTAIREAKKLGGDPNFLLLKGAILIDAGAATKSHEGVKEGVEVMGYVSSILPDDQSILYNLANGYHALATTLVLKCPEWYQVTYEYRLKARQLFYGVGCYDKTSKEIKTQSFTNLGNLLWSSYRWVEAYDAYKQAMLVDPRNGTASAGALKILRYAYSNNMGNEDLLVSEIESLATHVRANIESIAKYSGRAAVKGILEEIKDIPNGDCTSPQKPKDAYENFVLRHSLTLSPSIQRYAHEKERWDELNIYSVILPRGSEYQVPEVFAMFNVMKADYILARKLLFDGVEDKQTETGSYADTLDYANYGVRSSLLTLAQRASLDLLDKIAVASLSFFNIENARRASFKTAWYKSSKSNRNTYRPEVEEEIVKGNTALLAITEIANDLSESTGFLKSKQDVRNSSTHRFTVLHDIGVARTESSGCIEHMDERKFISETIETLKLARSALIYFVQMIDIHTERFQVENEGLICTLDVPSHEYIRHGEGEK